jgi:hypothetical protein
MKRYVLLCLLCSLIGCTSAKQSQFAAYGHAHSIKLYSGGELIGQWTSDGKVLTEEHSDGYYFTDKKTRKLVRISGDVVITPVD